MFWLLIVLLSLLGDGVCQDIGGSNSGNEATELLISEQNECEWESSGSAKTEYSTQQR